MAKRWKFPEFMAGHFYYSSSCVCPSPPFEHLSAFSLILQFLRIKINGYDFDMAKPRKPNYTERNHHKWRRYR